MILDGKKLSKQLKINLKEQIDLINNQRKPGLAVVLVGNNTASQTYVKNKEKACLEVGINSYTYQLDESVSKIEIEQLIDNLNNDDRVDGILIQLPLPKHLDEHELLNKILPSKDVDGFTTLNQGLLFQKKEGVVAATPKGIIKLLDEHHINISGLNAVVIGRSQIVGLPIAKLLLDRNASVSVCHSRTNNVKSYTKTADLIVVAVGIPNYLTKDMVKKGAIIIDVGINRINNKLVGDVDFENIKTKALAITPVPGGVGPMTIWALLDNCYQLYAQKN